AERRVVFAQAELLGRERGAGVVDDRRGGLGRETLEQHDELLAAEPGDEMALAALAKQRGDRAQHAVADAMAIGIVDPLEPVDVANGEADGCALLLKLGEALLERAPVGQAGERVGPRLRRGLGKLAAQVLRLAARRAELLFGGAGALD